MAKRLVHLVAQIEGLKTKTKDAVTEKYKLLQRPALFQGSTKVYEPFAAGDRSEMLPPEETKVQYRVRDLLKQLVESETMLIDHAFQQDLGNTQARADITVDGNVLKKDVPVTHLMYLRKRLMEMRTALSAIPTPDAAVDWVYDTVLDLYKSKNEVIVQKTAKVPFKFEKSPATDRFPAQVEILYRDQPIGEWHKREFSGAERADLKAAMLVRMDKLINAVKEAIESANLSVIVTEDTIGAALFDYVMEPLNKAYVK